METFWLFWRKFCRAYDSAYDSDLWFSLGHKRSYDSTYDSDSNSSAIENQPLKHFRALLFFFLLHSYTRTDPSYCSRNIWNKLESLKIVQITTSKPSLV